MRHCAPTGREEMLSLPAGLKPSHCSCYFRFLPVSIYMCVHCVWQFQERRLTFPSCLLETCLCPAPLIPAWMGEDDLYSRADVVVCPVTTGNGNPSSRIEIDWSLILGNQPPPTLPSHNSGVDIKYLPCAFPVIESLPPGSCKTWRSSGAPLEM